MHKKRIYIAVDLGAGSGRVLAGIYDGSKLTLEEVHRFASEAEKQPDGWHWNFSALIDHIFTGISAAIKKYDNCVFSIGVDTWGVDYGLINSSGTLLNDPFQYRDSRTDGMMEKAYEIMPKTEIYERTGIQFMFFNTLFQLLADRRLQKAEKLLFMPDLINHALTGKTVNERSIASTAQLLDPHTREWDYELLDKMDFPRWLFNELVDAGTLLGELLPEVAEKLGSREVQVVAVGAHDTASAVAGVPSAGEGMVFLSSGTWSLMGRELKAPVITDATFEAGFSNEGGVYGTTRLLKNIAGMWLLQESKKVWDAAGTVLSYAELVDLARDEASPGFVIDPDASELAAPENMPQAIAALCEKAGHTAPTSPAAFTRLILESLAAKYQEVKILLEKATGESIERIHIVGGGSQNALLNQLAADATGCEIIAGPVEATSLGNILVQMVTAGELSSLIEGRKLIQRSFPTQTYSPAN